MCRLLQNYDAGMTAGDGSANFRDEPPPPPEPVRLPTWDERFADFIERETGVRGTVRRYDRGRCGSPYDASRVVWEGAGICVSVAVPRTGAPFAYAADELTVMTMLSIAVRDAIASPAGTVSRLRMMGALTANEARALITDAAVLTMTPTL